MRPSTTAVTAPALLVLSVLVLAPASAVADGSAQDTPPPAPSADPAAAAAQTPRVRRHVAHFPLTLDCTAGSPLCPELAVKGDAAYVLPGYGPAPFRGFADPSIRREPGSGRLWLAYSWLHVETMSQLSGPRLVAVVDIHLAHSDDAGDTWTLDGPLWTSQAETDPGGSGRQGFSSHEVVSLAPGTNEGNQVWFAARLRYFTPNDSKLYSPRADSFQLRIAQAPSPRLLAGAAEAMLAGAWTATGWHTDVDLASLAPELAQCGYFNEPSLLFEAGTLYLEGQCEVWDRSGTHLADRDFLAIFATVPQGDVRSWRWRYVGRLADHVDALALGGDELMQTDLTHGRDGSLLAIVSPSHWDAALASDVHHGCRVIEVASLDPPTLRTNRSGAPIVRASITASDLATYGPAACAYEPASSTGVLFVRRVFSFAPAEMVWSIHRTGLRP